MTGGDLCSQHAQLLYSCCIACIVVRHAAYHRVRCSMQLAFCNLYWHTYGNTGEGLVGEHRNSVLAQGRHV